MLKMNSPISKELSINEKVGNKTGKGEEKFAEHHDYSLLSSTGSSSSDEECALTRKMDFLNLRSDESENSSLNFLTDKNGQNLILKLLENEEIREKKAKAFISYLIVNKMIHIESVLTEEKLLSWYDSFSKHDSSALLSSEEILSMLRSIDVIKSVDAEGPICKDADDNIVHFKDHVFLIRNDGENELPTALEIHRLRNEEKLVVEKYEFNCKMCGQTYDNPENLDNHYSSKIHILKKLHRTNRSWFASKIENLKVDKPEKINMDTNERKNIVITFKNVSHHYDIHIFEIFELVDLEEVKTEYSSNCRIEKNDTFKIILDVNFTQYGAGIFPIVIVLLLENSCEEFKYLLIEPTFNVTSKKINTTILEQSCRRVNTGSFPKIRDERRCIILEEPKPLRRCIILDTPSVFGRGRSKTATAKKEDPKTKWGFRNAGRGTKKLMTTRTSADDRKEVISAPRIARELEIPKLHLPPNEIPPSLNALFKIGFKTISNFSVIGSEVVKKFQRLICEPDGSKVLSNEAALNMENYADRFHFIMWMEEYQAILEIRSFDQHNISLITDRKNEKLMGINLPGLAEGRPSVLKGDTVIITPKGYVKKFEGVVEVVGENSIYVKMDNKFFIENLWKHQVSVNFRLNRTPLKMSHKTLDEIKHLRLENIIFPTSCEENVKSVQLKPFFNKSIEGNELQIQAIKNILENRAYPAPYILFGPPGTGKTATLVEAITQLWSTFNDSKICVCASSNAAADVIASRLLNYIPLTDIIRIYGLSRSDSEIISDLQNCCNYDPIVGEVYFPSINELRNKRVVVMTPVTAGRLVLSGIHFDYLFMDEAGHTVEVEMMIPIVGFLKKNISQGISGSLILAGDPKQLGPVVRSPSAIEAGFGISLLERLMQQCDLYKKDPETSKYNPKVITKLVNNYRSHDRILHIPNLRFYDNELLAKGSNDRISCLCQWKMLPTANFPVIFHSVKGKEERESNSPSYFNTQEIDIVEKYVRDLFDSKEVKIDESDIGIISPYRKQVHKIRQRLGKLWSEINVASVEEFQGQERKIIIISTVRSRHELVATDYKYGLGFLKNEKRFNVAITRAMALLVVIGNPDILQCDPNWRAFIEYCTENAAFIGESPSCTLPSNFDANEILEDFTHLKL